MEDLTKIGFAALTVLGSKDALNRLLGPTADYIGGRMRDVVEKCDINLDRVFRIATRKLGDRLLIDGGVSARVLKHTVDEARFCEDEVVAEYLGGVLASSRANGLDDDRAVCFLDDIRSLSSFQLRTHYVLYTAIARHGCTWNTNAKSWYGEGHETITVVFNDDSYLMSLGVTDGPLRSTVGKHSFLGLQARQLSRGGIQAYEPYADDDADPKCPWRYCWPTRYGHELFAWGLGFGDRELSTYFDIDGSAITDDLLPPLDIIEIDLGEKHTISAIRQY